MRELAGLVVDLDDDVLAEVLERDFRAEAGAEVPHLVRPLLELGVVGDAALERDRLVLGAAGRLAAVLGIAALAVLDDLGGALERADLADAGDVAAVPLHAELEVLVRIEALRVDGELCHGVSPVRLSIWPAICWILMTTNSAGLSGAKPTTMLTMPRLMSFCVVVSLSHLTK